MIKTEQDDFYPKKPFYKRHEFVGTLSKGDKSATDLQIVLQYSLIKEGEIFAKVIGNTDTYQRIKSILKSPNPSLTLSTKSPELQRIVFTSEDVILGTFYDKPDYGTDMSFKVADLRLWDLTVRHRINLDEKKERHLTFFLAGPRDLWTTFESRGRSLNGEEKVEVQNSQVELNEHFPFEIETRSWYFYDTTPTDEHFDLKTNIQVLSFKTIIPRTELGDDEFINSATSIADDLTLLISLISRRWVVWFRYELQTPEEIRSFIRYTRECTSKRVKPYDSVVEFHQSRNFIRTAFTELRTLRQSGFDLKMPLVYYISGNEAKYLEEQFTTFFLSLERIEDMFCIKKELDEILNPTVFNRLKRSASEFIRQEISNIPSIEMKEEKFGLIKQKLSELNRPAFRTVLDRMFNNYAVQWTDLYPLGSKLTLVKTRNELFHSSREIDINNLIKEKLRLQSLLERLLLSMLGWKDFSLSPIHYEKKWLSELENNDS